MDAIRSFIAIELPPAIQQKLDGILQKLKGPHTSAVRWVPARNIHLTLKFLGDVSPVNMELLKKMLQGQLSEQPAFQFTVGGLGAFPTPRRPRVIWTGVTAPPQLAALARLVEAETAMLGYAPEERPFSPHLTLGRVSQNATPEQVHAISEVLAGLNIGELGQVTVSQVVLFRSDLKPSGAEYTPLLKVPLLH